METRFHRFTLRPSDDGRNVRLCQTLLSCNQVTEQIEGKNRTRMYFEDDIAIDVDDLRFFGPQIRIDALDTVQGDTVLPDLQAITRKD
jgi:hypothetical protein